MRLMKLLFIMCISSCSATFCDVSAFRFLFWFGFFVIFWGFFGYICGYEDSWRMTFNEQKLNPNLEVSIQPSASSRLGSSGRSGLQK